MRDSLEKVGDAEVPLDRLLRSLRAMLNREFNGEFVDVGGAVLSSKDAGFRSIDLRVQPKAGASFEPEYVIYAQFSEPEGKPEPKRWWQREKKPSDEPWYASMEKDSLDAIR